MAEFETGDHAIIASGTIFCAANRVAPGSDKVQFHYLNPGIEVVITQEDGHSHDVWGSAYTVTPVLGQVDIWADGTRDDAEHRRQTVYDVHLGPLPLTFDVTNPVEIEQYLTPDVPSDLDSIEQYLHQPTTPSKGESV